MAEIPDHLVPTDGLANACVRIGAIYPMQYGVEVHMELYDTKTNDAFGTVKFQLGQEVGKPLISVLAGAHHKMNLILRQLLYLNDRARQSYETELEEHYSAS